MAVIFQQETFTPLVHAHAGRTQVKALGRSKAAPVFEALCVSQSRCEILTNEEILTEYNSIVHMRKWRRFASVLFSLACIGFGVAGFWLESIANIGQIDFHQVMLYVGAGSLGAASTFSSMGGREMDLLNITIDKLNVNDERWEQSQQD